MYHTQEYRKGFVLNMANAQLKNTEICACVKFVCMYNVQLMLRKCSKLISRIV